MDALIWVILSLISAVGGIFVGIWIGTERVGKAVREGSVGNLRIDRSEPDEPAKPFLELTDATIESISRKQFVILKVITESYLSPN